MELPGKGWESQIPGRAKGLLSLTEKNFGRLLIFFACCFCFLLNLPVPNETPAAKFRLTLKRGVWFWRLAAARANGAERGAGANNYALALNLTNAQRWDSGVMLISGSIQEMLLLLAGYGLRMMTGRIAR